MSPEGKRLLNIIILGFGFMFMFTAFQTCGNIEQTVLKSFNSTEFHGSGYTRVGDSYTFFQRVGDSYSSFQRVGGSYTFFQRHGHHLWSFLCVQPDRPLGGRCHRTTAVHVLQRASVQRLHRHVHLSVHMELLHCVCAGWSRCSNLVDRSGKRSRHQLHRRQHRRNSGIFWALLQFSLFFGNLYIYLAWHGHVHITDKDRQTVFISLTVISLVGCFLFFLIRKPDAEAAPSDASESLTTELIESDSTASSPQSSLCSQALDAFVQAVKLFFTKEMLLLSSSIAYSGLELTFYSGVYGTCIGAMTKFGQDSKSLIGISGICIGLGEIIGGGAFGMLNRCNKFGRNPVVLLGLITHFVAFYLIFLNIASDAPLAPEEGTDLQAFISPSLGLALFCSFLLGLGDSCFNTQLLSIIGFMYRENSAPAFAVFKFIQSIMAALAFFYSNYLLLHWQLLILVLMGFLGSMTFFAAERMAESNRRETDYDSI
ncbi:UNC93-like protein MFSD11 [Scomber scombrus]|uniref:UNC93-like protein MFSD11 n=1 Tax=Scomber scombrus TaxID=13677 RepID=UPI002DD91EA6|nr:UNC93-like protein MFSD11 [Scomber scombrus]